MLTLNIQYDVLPDRIVTIKLPETVQLGRQELLLVMNENVANNNETSTAKMIMGFSGTVSAFSGIDGVEYQRRIREEWR